MTRTVGGNQNVNNTPTTTVVALNSSTSTTLLTADAVRISYIISNDSSQDVWLKLQAASVDNLKEGIWLPKKTVYESMGSSLATSEISAISVSGSPSVSVVEI